MRTLFARKGGHRTVSRIVFDFYDRVLATPELASYFADVDMRRLVEHQAKFVASVMGGPAAHTDAELAAAHAHLAISDEEFDVMIGLMAAALEAEGFTPDERSVVLDDLERRRPFIVRGRGGRH